MITPTSLQTFEDTLKLLLVTSEGTIFNKSQITNHIIIVLIVAQHTDFVTLIKSCVHFD